MRRVGSYSGLKIDLDGFNLTLSILSREWQHHMIFKTVTPTMGRARCIRCACTNDGNSVSERVLQMPYLPGKQDVQLTNTEAKRSLAQRTRGLHLPVVSAPL